MAPPDPHSFADGDQARTRHVDLDLSVDFASRTIHGTALLKLDRNPPGVLDLDTRDIHIEKVTDAAGAPVPFSLDPPHPVKGSRLRLSLTSDQVTIAFRTSPKASALQWLEPAMTAGGKEPYLFSQCQAVHARSVFPCQDTPDIRITYSARLSIPAQLHAVMSARHVKREDDAGDPSRVVEDFSMEQSIPPYLFALAVGDITSRTLSPRVKIYAEPSIAAAAAEEFSGVESWISAAESLFGPYIWGEFNLLVMPPSFPYGGMENPRMAFLTPTLLVGDKSLVNVVAHELAHSWTGNLVTNRNYQHFWLNEGWTVYAERRILEAVEGKEKKTFHECIGFAELEEAVHSFEQAEKDKSGLGMRFTQLDLGAEGLGDIDPDEIFSTVPYEKGYAFLSRLEAAVGRVAFDEFVSKYIKHFALQSIDTPQFLAFLLEHLPSAAEAVNLDIWVHGRGIPPDAPRPSSAALAGVQAAAAAVAEASEKEQAGEAGELPSEETTGAWGSTEWATFVSELPRTLNPKILERMDDNWHLSENNNFEISVPFLAIAARSSFKKPFPRIESVLLSVGRMKYLKPLYKGLKEGGELEFAEQVYEAARPKYHPVAQMVIDGVLKK